MRRHFQRAVHAVVQIASLGNLHRAEDDDIDLAGLGLDQGRPHRQSEIGRCPASHFPITAIPLSLAAYDS